VTQQVKPINEAKDVELFAAIEDTVLAPLKEMWSGAIAQTAAFMENAKKSNMSKDDRATGLAGIWKPVLDKLDSLGYVQEHLMMRVNTLRAKGILEGDPRELEVLQVKPEA